MRIGECVVQQRGFSYLSILFVIAVAGVALASVGVNWSLNSKREKEQELIFVGNQYRQAISLYYERSPGAIKRYPKKLEDLLSDARFTPAQHYLRKIYLDPISGHLQMNLIKASDGGIMGVYSPSQSLPVKQANFRYVDASFSGVTKYSDWKFQYIP